MDNNFNLIDSDENVIKDKNGNIKKGKPYKYETIKE